MYRLDIHYSDGRTVPVTITKDEMLIGRDASCDVVLEDAITSRHHARLTCDDGGQYWIHDLQSKNGTTIDDQGVSRARVEVGNKIGIGGCYLTLVSEPTATRIVMSDTQDEAESATTNVWDATHRIDLPQQRLEKLYELNERLTGRFDRNDLLNEVVDICVESLRFERAGVAVWRGDPHPTEWVALRNLRADPSGEFRISRSLVDRALHNGERILINDTAMQAVDPTASMISNNIQSAMCVPMVYHDTVHGVVYGDRISSTGGYTREDIDFCAALARLGAMGLANVRLMEEIQHRRQIEMQIKWARQIQTDLFPAKPLEMPGLHIEGLNDPGQHVSGDYYDYFVRPDGLIAVVIADVMGKGIPASLLTANLQAAVQVTLTRPESELAPIVSQLNKLTCRNVSESRFITALFGLLDPDQRTFRYVNAGHPAPYLIGPDRTVSRLAVESALPLGVEDDFEYREEIIRFDEKPVGLFLFTDGVPDAENDSEERYEEQRLFDLLQENADLEPGELIARVRASIRQFTRNHVQTDDITLLVIRLE